MNGVKSQGGMTLPLYLRRIINGCFQGGGPSKKYVYRPMVYLPLSTEQNRTHMRCGVRALSAAGDAKENARPSRFFFVEREAEIA